MATTFDTLVQMIATMRSSVTDEVALTTIDMFPTWESVIGKQLTQDYITNQCHRFQYNNELYRLVQPHTPQADWTPDKTPALWVKVSLEEWPEWVQPAGAHDAYKKGDKVTHNGKKWTSSSDANVWEPGVFGWDEYKEG